jgi:Zn-dependent peptidase ImmA (M78 family)/transcriptional regulator with XRE-family HTH domain
MAKPLEGVNPVILKWARERSGYTVEDVALALKREIKEVENWELGIDAPTYPQLEKLSYQLYKRPIAVFFFPEPPPESDLVQSFRTLPTFEIENLLPDTRYAIRLGEAMQFTLRDMNDGINPSDRKIFQDIRANPGDNVYSLVKLVRNYLGIELHEQKKWKNNDEALKNWRNIIQDSGVFIFKRSFKQKDISGYCLFDQEFPLIYLNNSTSITRQIFSIFHELSHILFHANGITKQDDSYIGVLIGESREIEILCNKFAAEFLVPSEDFERYIHINEYNDYTFTNIANLYKVSRELILRKFFDKGLIDQYFYEEKVQQWNEEYEQSRKGGKGGNFYATQATYLGEKFLDLAFGKYYQGRFNVEQLADYLNLKVQHVAGLEPFVLKKASA